MADTYEQNLGQKSSLTTSDFIRVVGSDNVSYKQRVDNVMVATGVYPLTVGYTNPQVSAFSELKDSGFYTIGSASSYSDAPQSSYGFLAVFHGGSYAVQIYYAFPSKDTYIRQSTNNGSSWSAWLLQPTRAEIDALNSKTRVEISSTYASYIIVYKRGNVGFIRISNPKNLPANTTTDIGTIPEGYRPAWEMVTFMNERGASTGIGLTLTTAGLIRIYNYSTNTGTLNINEIFSYPIA